MFGRAAAVWFGIMLLAILNGAARDIGARASASAIPRRAHSVASRSRV